MTCKTHNKKSAKTDIKPPPKFCKFYCKTDIISESVHDQFLRRFFNHFFRQFIFVEQKKPSPKRFPRNLNNNGPKKKKTYLKTDGAPTLLFNNQFHSYN